ncbi:IS3 family transposase [Rhodococcus aetherivorans]|uniref:IS3 family transposase n=1 Tax=Rhodococcus aetherivorans TaxID=191292 RepID=UPI00163A8FFA|nr:IS3 family transposase [Rhodococcus aetherivorans]MBC2590746.1 IS3 family transposase [Rhodococcus aetherivorans]
MEDLESAVAEYINWFNHRRVHGEIGMIPPVEAEQAIHSIPPEQPSGSSGAFTEPGAQLPGALRPRHGNSTTDARRSLWAVLQLIARVIGGMQRSKMRPPSRPVPGGRSAFGPREAP